MVDFLFITKKEVIKLIGSFLFLVSGVGMSYYEVSFVGSIEFLSLLFVVLGFLIFLDFIISYRLRKSIKKLNNNGGLNDPFKKFIDCFYDKGERLKFVLDQDNFYNLKRNDIDEFSSNLFVNDTRCTDLVFDVKENNFEINNIAYSYSEEESIMKFHYHNYDECIYLIEGEWVIELKNGNEKYVLNESGDTIKIDSNLYHKVKMTPGSKAIIIWGRERL